MNFLKKKIGNLLVRKCSILEKQDIYSLGKKKSNDEILDDQKIKEIIEIQKPKYTRNDLVGSCLYFLLIQYLLI